MIGIKSKKESEPPLPCALSTLQSELQALTTKREEIQQQLVVAREKLEDVENKLINPKLSAEQAITLGQFKNVVEIERNGKAATVQRISAQINDKEAELEKATVDAYYLRREFDKFKRGEYYLTNIADDKADENEIKALYARMEKRKDKRESRIKELNNKHKSLVGYTVSAFPSKLEIEEPPDTDVIDNPHGLPRTRQPVWN